MQSRQAPESERERSIVVTERTRAVNKIKGNIQLFWYNPLKIVLKTFCFLNVYFKGIISPERNGIAFLILRHLRQRHLRRERKWFDTTCHELKSMISWILALRAPWIELPKIFMHRSANHVWRTIHELKLNYSFSAQVRQSPLVLRTTFAHGKPPRSNLRHSLW